MQGHGGKIANGSECSRRGESSRCLLGVEREAEKGKGRQSGGSRSQGWNRVSPKPAKPFSDMLNTVAVTFHPDSRPSGD